MSAPVRVEYRQNADYFIQAQAQNPVATRPLIPEKIQNGFLVVLVVGTIVFACAQEALKTHSIVVPVICAVCVLLIMGCWLWLFMRIGLGRTRPASAYRWQEKDRGRLEKRLQKKLGDEELLVTWQFDETGMRLNPEKPTSTFYDWGTIARAVETPGGLFVYVGRWTYFWFPRNVFSSPEHYAEVRGLIHEHVAKFEQFDPGACVYIALGSNMGKSRRIIEDAIVRLGKLSDKPLFVSSLWRTAPVDCPPDSSDFINAVVGLRPRPDETPESLLKKLQAMEKEFGRAPKKVLNEPRPLDLDLIAFGNEQRNAPELTIPHPHSHQRRFVLQPLAEIATDYVLPGQDKTVAQLLNELPAGEEVERLG
jgi:2-amino-4-hydroxy-6-hydroxymethyldihydropteridine diphosphokinase